MALSLTGGHTSATPIVRNNVRCTAGGSVPASTSFLHSCQWAEAAVSQGFFRLVKPHN